MAFRQSGRRSQTSMNGVPRPIHGNHCACAVCTDLGSMNESTASPRGRPGSLTGQSLQSGHHSQAQAPSGNRPSGSVGQPSLGSDRTQESTQGPRKKVVTTSPGQTAEEHTVGSLCIPISQLEDGGRAASVSPSPGHGASPGAGGRGSQSTGGQGSLGSDPVPDGQGGGGRDGGRDGQGGGRDRPKSASKNKSKRTPSGSRSGKGGVGVGGAGKGWGGGSGGVTGGEVGRGGQRPRPLCISEGRFDDMISVGSDDECDVDEEEIIAQECPPKDVLGEQQGAMINHTVAELGKREAVPYLPQLSDDNPLPPAPMDPLGPWAVGKPDLTPLGGLTGTRPIVDRYTITRYSLPEWRQRNLETFQRASSDTNRASLVAFNARSCIGETLAAAGKNEKAVTQSLQQRNADVRRWLPELHGSHEELWGEIKALSIEDDRLRRILCVLNTIAQLIGESIQIRTTRMEPDLTSDEVDQELTRELGLVNEIKQLLERTRDEIRKQLDSSRSAKHRLEQDIADKETTTRIDCTNIHLRVDSPTIMFSEGATRFMDNQSTPGSWEVSSRENLNISSVEMSKIRSLRALIQSIVVDSGRDLVAQKAKTEDTIAKHIILIASVIEDLQDQLNLVLRSIVETEQLIKEIKESLRKLDFPLKEAQTRLRNRQDRPRNENTRDCPQYALVDESKSIGEQATALMAQLAPAEKALQALFDSRFHLETELQSKKKNLFVDRDRILKLRHGYPHTEAIMAHAYSQCLPCR